MKGIMTHAVMESRRFAAALAFAALLIAVLPAHAQYMSFFGDSTWRYHVTYITQPPEDYLNYPPETPNMLGVYCQTLTACYCKNSHFYYGHGQYDTSLYEPVSCHDHDDDTYSYAWRIGDVLSEDTAYGRLYEGPYLLCDMSLSEGDTFVLTGLCDFFYKEVVFESNITHTYHIDTIHIEMIVDSISYIMGRKMIFLSLLDHQNDYFFGNGNEGYLSNQNLSIRFIEGVGPTYGLLSRCYYFNLDVEGNSNPWENNVYLAPWLGLLQCMYKDDSLVYMAHESLGCDQTCVGIQDHSQPIMNLYPNPATQYVVLDMSTGAEMDGMVVITDMLGRQCLQQKVGETSVRISVMDLPTGMYFLTYSSGKRKVTRKFLKR